MSPSPTDDTPTLTGRQLAEFRNPGDIQRVDEGAGVRYKRVMLLSPGMWADAGSQTWVDYNADAIRDSAENWVDIDSVRAEIPEWQQLTNDQRSDRIEELGETIALEGAAPINFLHGPAMYGADSLDNIGEIPLDSIIVDDDGALYGDLVLHGDSPQSETAIGLMDEVLEATQSGAGEAPPVGPSVEIPADRVQEGEGMAVLQEAWFSGVGIVFNPASRPVELGEQARDRAVAMTAASGAGVNGQESAGVVYRSTEESNQNGQDTDTTKSLPRHRSLMDDPSDFDPTEMNDDELARTLQTMQEDMAELQRTLQSDEDMQRVMQMMQAFMDEAEADESTEVAQLQSWMSDKEDVGDREMAVLEAYLEDSDKESLGETTLGELQSWLEANMGEGDEEGEEESDEPSDGEVTMEDIQAVKGVVGEVAEHMGDIKDMLQAREDQREETIDELSRRLSEIEDEPVNRSLAGNTPDEFYQGDESDSGENQSAPHEDVML